MAGKKSGSFDEKGIEGLVNRTPHGLPTDRADFNSYRRVAKRIVSEFKEKYGSSLSGGNGTNNT
ncbi:hypothetical protein BMS3Bbin11_01519 [bacterium BMS3Bbin11]|nr:hypothetical protein BMS3Abin11_01172 [bacterium BMS3Abin11]GBE46418.1 hypothetical protein BMS3Bbin11_01519 [bacterium BMS3Bbin11]HDH14869.1 hypothetical protein [Gammaproteobacteria bacterium]HDZ78323.1 hypothetical protein [Gammaproteobacteria bacterium]